MNEIDEGLSGRTRNLIVIAAMIAIVVVVYFGYRYHYAFKTADNAANFAEAVIRNSPVVNTHLGAVTGVKEIDEKYTPGHTPKVQLAFDVDGAKGDATVTVHLKRVNNNIWSMPEARMKVGDKDVNLR